VLVADELGPLPETILSRCQLVPFRRLSDAAVRAWVADRAPALDEASRAAIARSAAGRLDRAARLLDPDVAERRRRLLDVARDVYRSDGFDPPAAASVVRGAMKAAGARAREAEEQEVERRGLSGRDAEQRLRRAQRGAEREELLASLEELASWYRDLGVVGAGAEAAAVHADMLDALRDDAADSAVVAAAPDAAELARQAWREAEEFNVNAGLALEALFVRIRRVFA